METLIAKVNAFLSKFCIACKIPCDKQMHFLTGLITGVILTPYIGVYAVPVIAIIALMKEWYDYTHKEQHTAEANDMWTTILGGAVGFVIVSLF